MYDRSAVRAMTDDKASRSARGAPTVCLAMIVRNEAAVIERCLQSALPFIDRWVACDTGSTDDTPQRISNLLSHLPGALHRRPWRDFSWNRNELLDLAKGRGDYLLLLDADMTLEGDPLALRRLEADAYLLPVLGDVEYAMPYLVRASLPWRYEGATHEHIACDAARPFERLASIRIRHHADGGSRTDKFERDRDLLTRDLSLRPDNARAVFYLAQTYRDLGDHKAAVDLYRRRADMGGWDEEVFYALYQVGALTAQTDWQSAVVSLLAAWQARPTRAEPLYDLAVGYRTRGQYALALLFAEKGLRIEPSDDILFVSGWVHRWGLLFEYSVAAYWTGRVTEALKACRELAARSDLPEPWRAHNAQNLAFCEQALSGKPPST